MQNNVIIGGCGFMVNMILDPILIFSVGLGIHGAAVATIIAQLTAACLSIIALKKYKNRPFERLKIFRKPDWEIIKQIFKWVTPISVESFLFTFLTMLVAALVASYGAGALAASRVSIQIESLTWLIAVGYASALTAFTGQNFGAGKWGRIHKGFGISSALMAGWGLAIGVLLFFGGRALIGIFIRHDPEIVEIGVEYLRILALIQVPACLEGVAAGVFRGQGKTVPPSIASVVSNALRVAFAHVLTNFTGLGLTGIWIAIAAGAGVRGVWIYIWYLLYSRRIPKIDNMTSKM